MGELFEVLKLDPRALVLQIVALLVLFGLMKKYFFVPLQQLIEKRQAEISGKLQDAAKQQQEMTRLKDELTVKLAHIEEEARTKVGQAVKEGQAMKNEIVEMARKQAEKEFEKGKEEIRRETEKALVELRQHVADLAILAAGKVIEETLDDQRHRKLINNFVEKLESNN